MPPRRQPKDFKVSRRTGEPIEFTLGNKDVYHFTPPKQSLMVMAIVEEGESAAVRATMDWLKAGLPDKEYERLVARLKDPDDDFDIDTPGGLTDVVNWLTEESSGNPTG